jgi:hypothetical protein
VAELAHFASDRFLAALFCAMQPLETSSTRGVDADEFSISRCLLNIAAARGHAPAARYSSNHTQETQQ